MPWDGALAGETGTMGWGVETCGLFENPWAGRAFVAVESDDDCRRGDPGNGDPAPD